MKCKVEDFELFLTPCLSVYELWCLTDFSQIVPNSPNTLSNRYNLTLEWSWHFSMVLFDVKYRSEEFDLLLMFPRPYSIVFRTSFSKIARTPKIPKKVQLNPNMALRTWGRPYLKVNHGVRFFGLLFMCPSLDYLVSPDRPIVPSTQEQIQLHAQIALSLD